MDGLGGGTNNSSQNTINLRDLAHQEHLFLLTVKEEQIILIHQVEMLHLTGTEYLLVL